MAGDYEAVLTIESDDPDEEAVEVQIFGTALHVKDDEDNAPVDFRIIDVYPNPFNSTLQVTLNLPAATYINAQILDLSGRKAADLYTGKLTAGKHQLSWKADKQASGIYLLHVSSGRGETDIQKVILVR